MKRSLCHADETSHADPRSAILLARIATRRREFAFHCLRGSILVAVVCLLAACHGSQPIHEGPVYPTDRVQSSVMDIQVFRDETVIHFTNTTARAFPACRMWINKWFSKDIPALGVGQTMSLSLHDFKDQFGEPFRAGGFFASDRPARLVLAQLELEGELLGLIVVAPQE